MFLNFIHEHPFDVPEKEIYNLMRTLSKDRREKYHISELKTGFIAIDVNFYSHTIASVSQ